MNYQPKYAIGDTVWFAWTDTKGVKDECPDCGGTGVWPVTSPAGEAIDLDCPRCTRQHYSALDLHRTVHTFGIRQMTIGSVRMDAADEESPFWYMCKETGVGSGRIYRERDLFATREECEVRYAAISGAKQAEHEAKPEAIKAQRLHAMTFTNAMRESLKTEVEASVKRQLADELEVNDYEIHSDDFVGGHWKLTNGYSDGYYTLRTCTPDDPYGREICDIKSSDAYSHMMPVKHALATARLLRAAPNLLAAIRTTLDECPELVGTDVGNALESAVALATDANAPVIA